MAQVGDFSRSDGTGGESIYGGMFADENLLLMHDGPGLLSMANAGPDCNGSQFFIIFEAAPHLDGKHVVFGKLILGHDTLKEIERVEVDDTKPIVPVKIVDCRELSDTKNQDMEEFVQLVRWCVHGGCRMFYHYYDRSYICAEAKSFLSMFTL